MSDDRDLFTRLGGTRAMADMLGEAPSTVQSWKAAGRIPAHKQQFVIAKLSEAGKEITAEDVVWPMGKTVAEPAQPARAA